jgi:mono/diheme cytochrome c family protein
MIMNVRSIIALASATALWSLPMHGSAAMEGSKAGVGSSQELQSDLERGRYMVVTGHCNNCHTAGYSGKQGNIPEKEWLLGNPVGFRSPAGTTYGTNLRLTVQNFTEEQWVKYAKGAKPRPPMPWWSLHDTSEQDLRAMYRYIRHLGPAGKPTPDFVPPDKEPAPPYETRQIVR